MERVIEDPTLDALKAHLSEEHGSNGVDHDFRYRRDLSTQIPVTTLRRLGVLKNFMSDYSGDMAMVVAHALLDVLHKPLLRLDQVNYANPLQVEWMEREMTIEELIRKRLYKVKSREVLLAHGGLPMDDNRERNNSRRKRRVYYSSDKVRQRYSADGVKHKENQDEAKMIRGFVQPGQTVLKVLGEYDVRPLLIALSAVGTEGKVLYVSPMGHLKNRVFARIFDTLMNFSQFKGEDRDKTEPRENDVRLVNPAQLRKLRFLLMQPFLQDEQFYQSGFNDLDIIRKQTEVFYSHFPLIPINQQIPPFPRAISSGSVDTVMEMDRFSHLDEGQKEEFLWEVDRVLKTGGHFIVREDSRAQAEIEYYGQGLLDKDYKRQRSIGGLEHWARWMVFDKRGAKVFFNKDGNTNKKDGFKKRKQKETIKKGIDKSPREDLRDKLIWSQRRDPDTQISLRWFKDNGLLPTLMVEFGGNIEAAKAFAQIQDEPKKPDIFAGISRLKIEVPKDAKASYGLSDLSQDLGVPKSIVRTAVRRLGINTRGMATGRAGQSGFTRQAVRSRQLNLTYTEYVIVRDALKSQNLRSKNRSSENE